MDANFANLIFMYNIRKELLYDAPEQHKSGTDEVMKRHDSHQARSLFQNICQIILNKRTICFGYKSLRQDSVNILAVVDQTTIECWNINVSFTRTERPINRKSYLLTIKNT